MTGRVAPGWYPDYEAPPGHQRYWDGERWTERRSAAPEQASAGPSAGRGPGALPGWVWAAVAALLVLVVVVVVLVVAADDEPSSGNHDSASSTDPPGAPASDPTGSPPAASDPVEPQRTWQVSAVLDGTTVELTTDAEVRILGITDSCATDELARMLVDEQVTLSRRGPDKDGEGHLLRYVDHDGVDVGLRMIQRGLARASDEPHPRRDGYRRVDDRSPDACG